MKDGGPIMKKTLLLFCTILVLTSCTSAKIDVRSKGVVLRDNTVIHYLEAGQGPALVLVHGLGGSSDVWSNDIGILAKTYRVIAPDLPGYGKSDRPRADYSIDYHAAMLKEFIDALGESKVAIAGHSMGGWIAAVFTLNNPEKVSHLILVNSAGLHRETYPPVSLNPSTKEEQKTLLLALYADPSRVTERMINDQWEYRRDIRATVQATLDSLKTRMPLLDSRLADIKIPTLIIWGKQDTLIPLEFAGQFAKGIHGSKLVVIDKAGHLPQAEQPGAFCRAVKRFVKSW
jgi:pimeloyl-ACP methyl ester carboxylesterase